VWRPEQDACRGASDKSRNLTRKERNRTTMVRKITLLLTFFSCLALPASSQDFGLSFSYFLPRNGYFSTPISPFSIRGLGLDLNRFLALETGATLYRMSGMNLKDLPFESQEPLVGPNFTILIPAELVIQLRAQAVQLDLKAGGFFYYAFANKLNYGNFDRAFAAHQQWSVANGDLSFQTAPGFGYHAGSELTLYVTQQVGVSLEANYFIGGSDFPVSGTFTGGSGTLETITVDYSEAKMDFTGLELSIGLIFTGNSPSKAPRKRRR